MTEDALEILTKIGSETSLRYSIQLITMSYLISKRRKSTKVDMEDIQKVYSMFLDEKRSVGYLKEYEEQYLANESTDKMDTA